MSAVLRDPPSGFVKFSYGTAANDAHPKTITADSFAEWYELINGWRQPSKGLGYVCAPFRDGHRCADSALPTRVLPLDLDRIDADVLPELQDWLGDFSGVGWPTHSSTPDAPRARSMLLLDREVSRDELRKIGSAFRAEIGRLFGERVKVDEAVFRAEQPCYLPPVGVQVEAYFGDELVADEWLARVAAEEPTGEGHVEDFARAIALREVNVDTMADLRDALLNGVAAKRADEREDWVRVGHALKTLDRTEFAGEALALWHDFSSRSRKYDRDEADAKWQGFAPSEILYRSIFKWAQDDGWVNPRSAVALKTGDAASYSRLVDWTDTGNANLLAQITDGDLRYVPERHLWLWWDGYRWLADEHGAASHAAAQRVAQHYHSEAADLKERAERPGLRDEDRKRIATSSANVEKWAGKCRNKRAIDSMLSLASYAPALTVPNEELDRDPWLFGVANGVVDLRTGQLRASARDEFVTKRSSVEFDPSAAAPRWRQFIAEITGKPLPVEYDEAGQLRPETVGRFQPRPALAAYMQRALGYAMTGSTAEQKMFLAIGPGSNGKNVLLDIVQEITGDYCRSLAPEFLMATRHEADAERPSSTAASLAGARLAISSESKDGQRLDVGLVKRHTGGGYMTARLMRENTFRFAITHKLVLMTNHTPSLDHLDDALRGRLHLIPFDRVWNRPGHSERDETLPDGDKDLVQRLLTEKQGVLAWLVQGAVDYAREGLEPPLEVVRMTRAYFAEQDPTSRWLEGFDRCDPKHGGSAAELFRQFSQWHRDEDAGGGQGPQNEKTFAQALASRGVQKKVTKTGKKYGLQPKKVTGDAW